MAKNKHEKDVEKTVKWAEKQDAKAKPMTKKERKDYVASQELGGDALTNNPPEVFTNTLPSMAHKTDVTAKSFDAPEVNKGGRPTKYQTLFNGAAKKACSLGATDLDLAEIFGVEETTIHQWKKKYKRFSKSIEDGKAMIDRSLLNRALGCSVKETKVFCHEGTITTEEVDKYFPPDVAAQKHWLNNRKPKEWRDKREVDFTSPLSIVMDQADQDTL